jgi:hypothetical protein
MSNLGIFILKGPIRRGLPGILAVSSAYLREAVFALCLSVTAVIDQEGGGKNKNPRDFSRGLVCDVGYGGYRQVRLSAAGFDPFSA